MSYNYVLLQSNQVIDLPGNRAFNLALPLPAFAPTVERLAETGVPVVLALEKKLTNDGRDFIEIKDVVAIGWGPPAP